MSFFHQVLKNPGFSITHMAKQPSCIALTCTFCHFVVLYFIFIGVGFTSPAPRLKEKLMIRTLSQPAAVQEQSLPKSALAIETRPKAQKAVQETTSAAKNGIETAKKAVAKQKTQPDAGHAHQQKTTSMQKPQALPKQKHTSPQLERVEKSVEMQIERKKALLQKAQSALHKMQKMPAEHITTDQRESLQQPSDLHLQFSLAETSPHLDVSYEQELATLLQLLLTLPEHEEMDITLTLSCTGAVVDLKLKPSNSQRNRKYVKETLSQVSFPPFGREFPGEKEHTFSIKLSVSNL